MLTARAEYRLRLRADNAETRHRCRSPRRLDALVRRGSSATRRARLRGAISGNPARPLPASTLVANGAAAPLDGQRRTGAEWLRFAGVHIEHVAPGLSRDFDPAFAEIAEDARYAPYLRRQDDEVALLRANDAVRLPDALDYAGIPGLSAEMVERLDRARPATLGAAGRIRGITPAALTAILLHTRRRAA